MARARESDFSYIAWLVAAVLLLSAGQASHYGAPLRVNPVADRALRITESTHLSWTTWEARLFVAWIGFDSQGPQIFVTQIDPQEPATLSTRQVSSGRGRGKGARSYPRVAIESNRLHVAWMEGGPVEGRTHYTLHLASSTLGSDESWVTQIIDYGGFLGEPGFSRFDGGLYLTGYTLDNSQESPVLRLLEWNRENWQSIPTPNDGLWAGGQDPILLPGTSGPDLFWCSQQGVFRSHLLESGEWAPAEQLHRSAAIHLVADSTASDRVLAWVEPHLEHVRIWFGRPSGERFEAQAITDWEGRRARIALRAGDSPGESTIVTSYYQPSTRSQIQEVVQERLNWARQRVTLTGDGRNASLLPSLLRADNRIYLSVSESAVDQPLKREVRTLRLEGSSLQPVPELSYATEQRGMVAPLLWESKERIGLLFFSQRVPLVPLALPAHGDLLLLVRRQHRQRPN